MTPPTTQEDALKFGKEKTWLAGALALVLIGCGGSGGGSHGGGSTNGGSTNGGSTGSVVSDDIRMATLDKIGDEVDRALQNGVPDAQLAQTIRNEPGIVGSGASEGGSVWAQFADGRVVVISTISDESDEGAAIPAATVRKAATRSVPNSRNAYVFDGAGKDGPTGYHSVQVSLELGGYAMQSSSDYDNATVDALKTVQNAAVFCISTHGGVNHALSTSSLGEFTAAKTATPVSRANDAKYRDDLADDSLNYMIARRRKNGSVYVKSAKNYCFTHKFVRKYMTFAPDSVAIVDSCNSYRIDDFADAFAVKGASAFFGWSNSVKFTDSRDAMSYLFDRLIGVNDASPQEPGGPQRPFGYREIFEAMGKKDPSLTHFDSKEGTTVDLKLNEAGFSEGALAPSITTMTVAEETSQLNLQGSFPDEEGTVQINGHNLPIRSWDSRFITVDLPVTGEDASGDVRVFYQGRKSNVATLTEWTGRVKYTYQDLGSLKEEFEADVRFRADARRYRLQAGETPVNPSHAFGLTSDCTGTFRASGSYADDFATYTWDGTANLKAPQVDDGQGIQFQGGISGEKVWFQLGVLKSDAYLSTYTTKFEHTETREVASGLEGELFDEDGKIEVPLNRSDYVFPAGRRTARVTSRLGGTKPTESTLEWTNFTPKHLPRPETGR